jgi:hypothetical protein
VKTILVAMHLVACQPDLLICKDISSVSKTWQDMEACREDRNAEMARARKMLARRLVIMSRCRYLPGRDRRSMPMF